jgi:hypothetical protein
LIAGWPHYIGAINQTAPRYKTCLPNGSICSDYIVYSKPIIGLGKLNANFFFYEKVSEDIVDNGSNEYFFSVDELDNEIDDDYLSYPYIPKRPLLKTGKIVKKIKKDESGHVVKETEYEYDTYYREILSSNDNDAMRVIMNCNQEFYPYYMYTGFLMLTDKKEKIYSSNNSNPITQVESYEYGGIPEDYKNNIFELPNDEYHPAPDHHLKTQIGTTNSNGESEIIKISYPFDYNTNIESPLSIMCNKHILNFVIEKQTFRNNKIISAKYYKYENISIPNVKRIYSFETNSPIEILSFIGLDEYGNLKSSSMYRLTTSIDDYDNYGNPVMVKTRNGLTTTYGWGYNGQYLTSKTISGEDNLSLTESWDWHPLIGMKSHTAHNGFKTYYEYDTFNRLSTIRNDDGDILRKYEYNYSNN